MRQPLVRIVLAALLAAAALAQPALEQEIGARLTANGLKADVSFLASDALEGRGTPSPGLDIAAEYIAAQFRRAGLEPAGDDGYFQTAPFASVAPVGQGLQLTLETAAGKIAVDAQSMAIQEAAALDLAAAPAIRVSLADTAAIDQLAAAQAEGKVLIAVLPDSGGRGNAGFSALRRLSGAAAKARAALVIVVRATPQAAPASSRLREVSAGDPPVPMLAVWDPAARSALDAKGDVTVSVHMAAPAMTPVKLRNVIGVLRGSDPTLRNTYVLVTAHYDHLGVRGSGPGDHIYNGANDDASGTASVVELAQTLAALPERPKRSIVFMTVFGEELGLAGVALLRAAPGLSAGRHGGRPEPGAMGRTDDNTDRALAW